MADDEKTSIGQGNKGLSDRQKIDAYLSRAEKEVPGFKRENIGVPTTEKKVNPSYDISIGRQARAAFSTGKAKNTVNLREQDEEKLISRLFNNMKGPKPPRVKLPFEGMKTSVLPKEDLIPPPPPKSSYEKPVKPKPPNFQRLQDAVNRRRLERLGQIERLGHNISKLGQQVNQRTSGWPYLPGGLAFPLALLFILLLLLIPVNGKTRIQWLWASITGDASVNPNYDASKTVGETLNFSGFSGFSGINTNVSGFSGVSGTNPGQGGGANEPQTFTYVPLSNYVDDEY